MSTRRAKIESHQLEGDRGVDFYREVEAVAAEVARDELAIKQMLMCAIRQGNSKRALAMLGDWCERAPHDILEKYQEIPNGKAQ